MNNLSQSERHAIINDMKSIIKRIEDSNVDNDTDIKIITLGLRHRLNELRSINSKLDGL